MSRTSRNRTELVLDELPTSTNLLEKLEESALERHYTVKEIAEMWQLDEKMIRRVFGDEPGVVNIGSNESRFRRAYRTLRIPESVLVRVHRRLRRAG